MQKTTNIYRAPSMCQVLFHMLRMLTDIITRLYSRLGQTPTKLLGMELSLMVRTRVGHFGDIRTYSHLGVF